MGVVEENCSAGIGLKRDGFLQKMEKSCWLLWEGEAAESTICRMRPGVGPCGCNGLRAQPTHRALFFRCTCLPDRNQLFFNGKAEPQ